MKYVEKGGTLLVQYNVNNLYGLKILALILLCRGPGNGRGCKSNLACTCTPALNYPNQITDKDFEGWVQESGLYFATKRIRKYTPLLSMNDKGETAKRLSDRSGLWQRQVCLYRTIIFQGAACRCTRCIPLIC